MIALPKRAKLLTERLDPICIQSLTLAFLNVAASAHWSFTLMAEPHLAKLLIEIFEVQIMKSWTLRHVPILQ